MPPFVGCALKSITIKSGAQAACISRSSEQEEEESQLHFCHPTQRGVDAACLLTVHTDGRGASHARAVVVGKRTRRVEGGLNINCQVSPDSGKPSSVIAFE